MRGLKDAVNGYSAIERDVRAATANDAWSPPATLLAKIAIATQSPYVLFYLTRVICSDWLLCFSVYFWPPLLKRHRDQLVLIINMIWRRIYDFKVWRHMYKAWGASSDDNLISNFEQALCLTEYLLKTGSEEFVCMFLERMEPMHSLES